MKKYVSKMNQLLSIQHPQPECNCFSDFDLDEDFLCDLCLARLKEQRRKLKKKIRRQSKMKYKMKYHDE